MRRRVLEPGRPWPSRRGRRRADRTGPDRVHDGSGANLELVADAGGGGRGGRGPDRGVPRGDDVLLRGAARARWPSRWTDRGRRGCARSRPTPGSPWWPACSPRPRTAGCTTRCWPPGAAWRPSYDKIHLFDAFGFAESDTVAPGDEPVTIEVDGLTVGLATCYDLRFPGLFQLLADRGATLVVVPASWGAGPGKREQWDLLVRARALDSTTFVAACGQADPTTVGRDPGRDGADRDRGQRGGRPARRVRRPARRRARSAGGGRRPRRGRRRPQDRPRPRQPPPLAPLSPVPGSTWPRRCPQVTTCNLCERCRTCGPAGSRSWVVGEKHAEQVVQAVAAGGGAVLGQPVQHRGADRGRAGPVQPRAARCPTPTAVRAARPRPGSRRGSEPRPPPAPAARPARPASAAGPAR